METSTHVIIKWKESLVSDIELLTLLKDHAIHGGIEDDVLCAYDYNNQEWIKEHK